MDREDTKHENPCTRIHAILHFWGNSEKIDEWSAEPRSLKAKRRTCHKCMEPPICKDIRTNSHCQLEQKLSVSQYIDGELKKRDRRWEMFFWGALP